MNRIKELELGSAGGSGPIGGGGNGRGVSMQSDPAVTQAGKVD